MLSLCVIPIKQYPLPLQGFGRPDKYFFASSSMLLIKIPATWFDAHKRFVCFMFTLDVDCGDQDVVFMIK